METDARLLKLSDADNVVVATQPLPAGETVLVSGVPVTLPIALKLGHKLACAAIAAHASVVKYGAPIGSAVRDIALGEHVHVHNIKSDYTPTYHLGAGGEP